MCGEPAVDDEARFCIGCGGALEPGPDAPAPLVKARRRPPGPVFIDAPPVSGPPPRPVDDAPTDDVAPPTEPAPKLPPLVPLWMVVAGVWGLIALLVVLLLSR